jgi:gas vesicle protein
MSKSKVALGALVGVAVGVAAGILTAPKSGKETRADIRDKANQVKIDVAKKAEYAASKASDMTKDAKTKVHGITDNVMSEAGELKDRTGRAVEGAKKGFFDKK